MCVIQVELHHCIMLVHEASYRYVWCIALDLFGFLLCSALCDMCVHNLYVRFRLFSRVCGDDVPVHVLFTDLYIFCMDDDLSHACGIFVSSLKYIYLDCKAPAKERSQSPR